MRALASLRDLSSLYRADLCTLIVRCPNLPYTLYWFWPARRPWPVGLFRLKLISTSLSQMRCTPQ